jgi:Tfp pilus assembly protein PilF
MAIALNNAGCLFQVQGLYQLAERYFDQALQVATEAIGAEAPLVGSIATNLALLADQRGPNTLAEQYYQRALVLRQRALGLHHPDVGTILEHYARLLYRQGQPVEAGLFMARALKIRQRHAVGEASTEINAPLLPEQASQD